MWGLKAAMKMPKCVQVEWEDGLLATFNYVWLRDNSLRRPSLVHLDLNAKPEAINCSRTALNLVWPPFNATNYSSDFLRENVSMGNHTHLNSPTTSLSTTITNPIQSSHAEIDPSLLNGQICQIVSSSPIERQHTVGQLVWQGGAQEPGTIWPHMQSIPTVCAVDVLSAGPVNLSIVDTSKALARLFEEHPVEFEFLAQCVLEYSEGMFKSRHPVCQIQDGKIQPGVFNNAARSSSIVVEPLEKLYESLQKFGRICAQSTHIVQLQPGQRLLVDNQKAMLGAPAQFGRELLLRCLI